MEASDDLAIVPSADVSVVIPTYNRASILPRAIDSVLAQRLPPGEIIVVDDGSTDGTDELLERYQAAHPELLRVIHQRNAGAPAARNAGITAASQEFVALLDSDDAWRPAKLVRQMALFDADPSLEFCFTGIMSPGDPATSSQMVMDDWQAGSEQSLERLLMGCCIVASSVVAKRQLLNDVGLFDPELRLGDDYDLYLRLAETGHRIAYIAEPLTIVGGEITGIASRASEVNASYEHVLKRHLDGGRLPGPFLKRRRWFWSRRYLNNASHSLEQADYADTIAALTRAFLVRPASARLGWLRMFARAVIGLAADRWSYRSRNAPG